MNKLAFSMEITKTKGRCENGLNFFEQIINEIFDSINKFEQRINLLEQVKPSTLSDAIVKESTPLPFSEKLENMKNYDEHFMLLKEFSETHGLNNITIYGIFKKNPEFYQFCGGRDPQSKEYYIKPKKAFAYLSERGSFKMKKKINALIVKESFTDLKA